MLLTSRHALSSALLGDTAKYPSNQTLRVRDRLLASAAQIGVICALGWTGSLRERGFWHQARGSVPGESLPAFFRHDEFVPARHGIERIDEVAAPPVTRERHLFIAGLASFLAQVPLGDFGDGGGNLCRRPI